MRNQNKSQYLYSISGSETNKSISMKCQCITKANKPCSRSASKKPGTDTTFCYQHQDCQKTQTTTETKTDKPQNKTKTVTKTKKTKPKPNVAVSLDALLSMSGVDETIQFDQEDIHFHSYVDDRQQLVYALDYRDVGKQKAFLATCRVPRAIHHMVMQEWIVTEDGKLYLANQDNNSISYICEGPPEVRTLFRGSARKLWCYFLGHGLEKGIFSPETIIRLEVRGSLAHLEENVEKGQERLEEFYRGLGFKEIGRDSMWRTPLMEAPVKTVLTSVCKQL